MVSNLKIFVLAFVCSLSAACGGDRSHSDSESSSADSSLADQNSNSTQNSSSAWIAGQYDGWHGLRNVCANPSEDETLGTVADENNWIRSYSHDTYLWYRDLPDIDPASVDSTETYFDLMKTSGDRFHFSVDAKEWRSLMESGLSVGYGATFKWSNRGLSIAYVEPSSPASSQGLSRGATIIAIDGVKVESMDINRLNETLFPTVLGQSHKFEIEDLGASQTRHITMVSADIVSEAVKNQDTFERGSKTIGYITFNDHTAISQHELKAAVSEFRKDNIDELVVDMRYNGGGYLRVAAQLGYMIAGADSEGRVFAELQFNDKHNAYDPITGEPLSPIVFHPTANTLGKSLSPDDSLPVLNLDRVFILTGESTASASEALINGLRGIDIEVILIGEKTRGKPYGFYGLDNCGTAYFTVQFRTLNEKGFSDYASGFTPDITGGSWGSNVNGCKITDDLSHRLGDSNEALLSTALSYIELGSCPDNLTSGSPDDDGFQRDRPDRYEGIMKPELGQILQ
jgi:C-terminal processing protease CtpA/Prc